MKAEEDAAKERAKVATDADQIEAEEAVAEAQSLPELASVPASRRRSVAESEPEPKPGPEPAPFDGASPPAHHHNPLAGDEEEGIITNVASVSAISLDLTSMSPSKTEGIFADIS